MLADKFSENLPNALSKDYNILDTLSNYYDILDKLSKSPCPALDTKSRDLKKASIML